MNQEAALPACQEPKSQPAVLVVEGDVFVRVAAARYLRDCGFEVFEAVDAQEALELLRTSKSLAVVFADVKLPGAVNGVELKRVIQNEHPHVKVLMTSGVTSVAALDRVDLLRKPYILRDVERQIRALLAL